MRLTNNASINLMLVLTIMNLALLAVMVELNHILTYEKIFSNEKSIYADQLDIDMKLVETANADIEKFPQVGFLPDNLSFLCSTGINVYQMNVDSNLYGYWGLRDVKTVDINFTKQQKLYYKMLFKNKNVDARKLKVIDLLGNNQVDQVFFLDISNWLWRYDVTRDQMFLQSSNINNINYIIGSDIFNITTMKYQSQSKYIIYLHSRENNDQTSMLQDVVKLIYSDNQRSSNQTLDIIISNQAIMHFFLRSNYIILLHEDVNVEPEVYKLYDTGGLLNNANSVVKPKMLIKKFYVEFNRHQKPLNNYCAEINLPKYELLWDPNLKLHKINIIKQICELITYEFKLPTDNSILSFKTNDY